VENQKEMPPNEAPALRFARCNDVIAALKKHLNKLSLFAS